jgi:hypothetical protein
MKRLVWLLLLLVAAGPVLAVTGSVEATGRSFWTEFDLAFWQTLPFATFWSYAVATQIAQGGALNWSPVMNAALLFSLGNAVIHARQVAK